VCAVGRHHPAYTSKLDTSSTEDHRAPCRKDPREGKKVLPERWSLRVCLEALDMYLPDAAGVDGSNLFAGAIVVGNKPHIRQNTRVRWKQL